MILIYGAAQNVTRTIWNGVNIWTTGLRTPWEIIKTYTDVCVMVVSEIDDLREDMTDFYVINEGGYGVSEEAVLRGAFCLNCKMKEGLWRLRDVIAKYK